MSEATIGTEEINLRWNNHTNNMLQVFMEHLTSESLVDVTLSCEGKRMKAHKIILSACSPFFQDIFKNHDTKHPVIILNDIRYEDLQTVIKFMYHGEIRIQETELDELLATAETLQIKGLSHVRSKYSIKSTKTVNNDTEKEKATEGEGAVNTDNSLSGFEEVPQDVTHSEGKGITPARKRRKMSHTVNELAKEAIFTTSVILPDPVTSSSAAETETSETKVVKETQKQPKIPRPPNAFMIFANEWRKKLAYEYPEKSNTEISVRLGTMWKGLSTQAKEGYYKLAKKADEDHKRKYPGYYYSPKEARLRKTLRKDLLLSKYQNDANALRLVKVYMNIDDGGMLEVPVDKQDTHEKGSKRRKRKKSTEKDDSVIPSSNTSDKAEPPLPST